MRAAVHACDVDRGPAFVLAATRLAFCGGFDLDDPEVLAEAAAAAGLELDACLHAGGDEVPPRLLACHLRGADPGVGPLEQPERRGVQLVARLLRRQPGEGAPHPAASTELERLLVMRRLAALRAHGGQHSQRPPGRECTQKSSTDPITTGTHSVKR